MAYSSHLQGLATGYQVTVKDWDCYAEVMVFTPGRGFDAQVSQHSTLQAAMDAAVKMATHLGAWHDESPVVVSLPMLADLPAPPVLSDAPHCEGHAFPLGARR